jgi:hypothetical protein
MRLECRCRSNWKIRVLDFFIHIKKEEKVTRRFNNKIQRLFFRIKSLFSNSSNLVADYRELTPLPQIIEFQQQKFQSCSQNGQDIIAQTIFQEYSKSLPDKVGVYLELGGSDPVYGNNSYILEAVHEWKGISIEWSKFMYDRFVLIRKNRCINNDALELDYENVMLSTLGTLECHFLSLDIDPAKQTYTALKKILCGSKINPLFITFEHDKYRGGPIVQIASTIRLQKHGYTRLVKDVEALNFGEYEDWWVLKNEFDQETLWRLKDFAKNIASLVRV